MKKTLWLLAFIAAPLMIISCTKSTQVHGHIIKDFQIEKLKKGLSDKRDVLIALGSPSTVSNFNDNRWYYISEITQKKAMGISETKERKVLIVDFNENGKVKEITQKGLADGKNIAINERETPTAGESLGIIEQMIENVGKGM